MKNIIKFTVCFSLLIFLGVGGIGCSTRPKGDPLEVIKNYYENVKNNKSDESYELLANENKAQFEKDDFAKLHNLKMQSAPLKETKIEKTNEYKDKDINGTKYKNVVEFNVTETLHDAYDDKDVNNQYKRYVVSEDGNWKLCSSDEKTDIKEDIAKEMARVSGMYIDGRGQTKDLNKAASILTEAVSIKTEYAQTYYILGTTLSKLGRYDESINNIQEFLNKTNDDKGKSDAYNVLGVDYEVKKDYSKAKENYNKAIELDNNNQYAKTNLERVNNLSKLGF